MNKNTSLIKFLRVLCVIGEVFTCIGLCVMTSMIPFSEAMVDSRRASIGLYVNHGSLDWSFIARLPYGTGSNFTVARSGSPAMTPEYGNISLGPLRLNPGPTPFPSGFRNADAQAVVIDDIEGIVTIKRPERAAEVLASIKWPFVAGMLCTGGVGLAILELLRRMFRSAERGEVFTSANIRNVRRIGFLLIASSILKLLTAAWLVSRMAAYVMQHVAAGKVNIESSSEGNLSGLVTGLMILALAEVFRQGLTLKEDSRLTI